MIANKKLIEIIFALFFFCGGVGRLSLVCHVKVCALLSSMCSPTESLLMLKHVFTAEMIAVCRGE